MTSPDAGTQQAAPVGLPAMPPAQGQGSELLVRLDATRVPWVLIGGQMMVLLAVEHGVELPRTTLDADVLVDVRARPGGIETVATWLTGQRLEMEGPSPMGIGHRLSRAADPGPGKVIVDLLAPEGLRPRTAIYTRPPARTISVPASTTLLHDAVPTAVQRVQVCPAAAEPRHRPRSVPITRVPGPPGAGHGDRLWLPSGAPVRDCDVGRRPPTAAAPDISGAAGYRCLKTVRARRDSNP